MSATNNQKKTFFASDMHFGAPDPASSLWRERCFVRWLDSIKPQADALYLLGDIFDFWFEYRHAAPQGHVRLLGKLAELSDAGVQLHIFTGNHDQWYRSYLAKELQAEIVTQPVVREIAGRTCYLAHGDGLGPGDHGYKFIKWLFSRKLPRWLYRQLHPDVGIRLARYFSRLGGDHNYEALTQEQPHHGEEEFLYQHARKVLETQPGIDLFIFGHRHLLLRESLTDGSELIFLGDWIVYFSYLTLDEHGAHIETFSPANEDFRS